MIRAPVSFTVVSVNHPDITVKMLTGTQRLKSNKKFSSFVCRLTVPRLDGNRIHIALQIGNIFFGGNKRQKNCFIQSKAIYMALFEKGIATSNCQTICAPSRHLYPENFVTSEEVKL